MNFFLVYHTKKKYARCSSKNIRSNQERNSVYVSLVL